MWMPSTVRLYAKPCWMVRQSSPPTTTDRSDVVVEGQRAAVPGGRPGRDHERVRHTARTPLPAHHRGQAAGRDVDVDAGDEGLTSPLNQIESAASSRADPTRPHSHRSRFQRGTPRPRRGHREVQGQHRHRPSRRRTSSTRAGEAAPRPQADQVAAAALAPAKPTAADWLRKAIQDQERPGRSRAARTRYRPTAPRARPQHRGY